MKIAVLGTGIVGRQVSTKLASLGHEVVIGTRDVENTMTSDQQDFYGNPVFKDWFADQSNIKLETFANAAAGAEIIVNATNGQASIPAISSISEADRSGKTLLDIANPLDFSNGMPPSLNPVNTDSLAEQIQSKFPELNVVKSLNTMSSYIMINPSQVKGKHDVFVSGNDDKAKEQVKELLKSIGWTEDVIIDLGDISTARGTEMLLPIWLRLWNALGTADFNFHVQRN